MIWLLIPRESIRGYVCAMCKEATRRHRRHPGRSAHYVDIPLKPQYCNIGTFANFNRYWTMCDCRCMRRDG